MSSGGGLAPLGRKGGRASESAPRSSLSSGLVPIGAPTLETGTATSAAAASPGDEESGGFDDHEYEKLLAGGDVEGSEDKSAKGAPPGPLGGKHLHGPPRFTCVSPAKPRDSQSQVAQKGTPVPLRCWPPPAPHRPDSARRKSTGMAQSRGGGRSTDLRPMRSGLRASHNGEGARASPALVRARLRRMGPHYRNIRSSADAISPCLLAGQTWTTRSSRRPRPAARVLGPRPPLAPAVSTRNSPR